MSEIIKGEKWIGTKEAAEYLGVQPATIRDWIRKGKDIPRKKIGKAWKFKLSELVKRIFKKNGDKRGLWL